MVKLNRKPMPPQPAKEPVNVTRIKRLNKKLDGLWKKKKKAEPSEDIMDALSLQHRTFVREYLKDYNGKEAAIRSGYSEKSAHVSAGQLLSMPKIILAIESYEKRLDTRFINTKEKILKEFSLIAHSDIADYDCLLLDSDTKEKMKLLPPQVSRAIKKLTVHRTITRTPVKGGDGKINYKEFITENSAIELYDKPSALEKMGKEINMFKEKVELSNPDGGPIRFVVEYTNKPLQETESEC